MMVIRLARGGSKKKPFYSVVATDSCNRRDGRFVERLGFYNPVAPEGVENLRIALDRMEYWTGHGAQLSPTVARLLRQYKKQAGHAQTNKASAPVAAEKSAATAAAAA